MGSHGFLGKENMYDHSTRVPLLISGPGVPAGLDTQRLSMHADLYPTLCELAGLPTPETATDGRSLAPLLRDKDAPAVRDAVYGLFRSPQVVDGERGLHDTQRTIRTEKHKLNWYPMSGRFQLFDLVHDPDEQDDLLARWRCMHDPIWDFWNYSPPQQEDAVLELAGDLRDRLASFLNEQGDPLGETLAAIATKAMLHQ